MKTMTAIQGNPFYNSTSTLADAWYAQPRRSVRKKLYLPQLDSLDERKHKQEVVCALILAASLLFTFFECATQFATF